MAQARSREQPPACSTRARIRLRLPNMLVKAKTDAKAQAAALLATKAARARTPARARAAAPPMVPNLLRLPRLLRVNFARWRGWNLVWAFLPRH